jgi:hypothetical protein
MTLSPAERYWLRQLRTAHQQWEQSTAYWAKKAFNPVTEQENRTDWFRLLDARELYLQMQLTPRTK